MIAMTELNTDTPNALLYLKSLKTIESKCGY